jgi:spermidine synthase
MLSAKLLNNYAFLAISLTMLGFAFSGVVLTRFRARLLSRLDTTLAVSAGLFVVSTLLGSVVLYRGDIGVYAAGSRGQFVGHLLWTIPLASVFAVPFVFCGLILGALLSAPGLPTRMIYGLDLAGSALGAVLVVPAIVTLGVERSMVLACALLLLGALALAPRAGAGGRSVLIGASLLLVMTAVGRERVLEMRYPRGSMLDLVGRLGAPYGVEHTSWDSVSRIEVSRIPPPDPARFNYPSLIGPDRAFHQHFRRVLTQNNFAFTYMVDYDGSRASLRGIHDTIYAAAYHAALVSRPRVLVIGVGGGFDVLTALYFDASSVTGVEINAATIDILTRTYRSFTDAWVGDPRVRIVSAEGRRFLAESPDRFDVIQLSGVDSYSGTAGAAHVFSENYLYTAEAFDLYLSRLTDDGILNMMRLENLPAREMLRALTTAVEALRRAGVTRPADHIVMLSEERGNFTAMLVKRKPFDDQARTQLAGWTAERLSFQLSTGPGARIRPIPAYQAYLSLADPDLEAAFVGSYPLDIEPATDDRPFFFRHSMWSHVWRPGRERGLGIPYMEYTLLVLFAVVGSAGVLCAYLPLHARALEAGDDRSRLWRYGVFFAAIATGYMATEIAFIQKFGLFLGHPNHALSVVLAVLLLATGVGAVLSTRLIAACGGVRFATCAVAGLLLAEYWAALPHLGRLIGLPFVTRVLIVIALVAPVGIGLGVFMPMGLDDLKRRLPALAPWAWGVNGVFSVIAPVASVAFSMTWGISALLPAASLTYVIAGLAFPTWAGRGAPVDPRACADETRS